MHSEQQLNETMWNQFVQCQEFFIRFEECVRAAGSHAGARLKSGSRFANDGILERLTGDLPQRNETIDSVRKTDSEYSVITRGSQRLEIQIEWPAEAVGS